MSQEADLYRTWKDWRADAFATLSTADEGYYRLELSRAGVPDRPLRVLEIGFGNGGFAAFARARGWTYTGTEIDPALVARGQEAGFDVHRAPVEPAAILPDGTADLITAFDVLEHLDHDAIVAMLRGFRACLAADGRIVARFPSGDSPFSGAMQAGDRTHRSQIGTGMMRQFCIEAGLVPLQIRAPAMPVRGLGPVRGLRRALVLAARAPVRAFLRAAFYDNRPAVIDPNMLVVLGRPRD